jgi:hypothetical protein
LVSSAWGSVESLKRHVALLASDELHGRLTGSDGERRAAEYLVRELEAMGAVPLPGASGFLHEFEFAVGKNDTGSTLAIVTPGAERPEVWTGTEHVRALSFSDNGTVTGSLVFAGYGLDVPESEHFDYDSYADLDVANKIVVVLRYEPEQAGDAARAEFSAYSGLRRKALLARKHGAKALLVVTGPNSPHAGTTVTSRAGAALGGSGMVAASIGGEAAARIFHSVEGGLAGVQSALDTGNPHVKGFDIPLVTVTLDVRAEREERTGRNVIGLLPPDKPDAALPYVVLGAHYDNLGRGQQRDSSIVNGAVGRIRDAAADDASGVAAVLDAGAGLAGRPRPVPIVLAFWSGQALGLLGADDFVQTPSVPVGEIAAYLNFDRVGRVQNNRLSLRGVGSSSVWPRLIEQTNVVVGFDVRIRPDPHLPTDASVFYLNGVPIVDFSAGGPGVSHQPTDRADTLNYDDLDRVAQFGAIFAQKIGRLDEPPDYVKIERRGGTTVEQEDVRPYTGTIPDYAAGVEGLRLSGVADGGPAERAGLQEGDVIIEFAGVAIANVHDYARALGAAKIGESITVVYLRDGKRSVATLTPTARP